MKVYLSIHATARLQFIASEGGDGDGFVVSHGGLVGADAGGCDVGAEDLVIFLLCLFSVNEWMLAHHELASP